MFCSSSLYHTGVRLAQVKRQVAAWLVLPEVVAPAEDEVGFGVKRGAHLTKPAIAAGAFQAVLMPVLVQGLQQVAVLDLPAAAGAAFWLGVRLDGEHLYTCGIEKWEKMVKPDRLRLIFSTTPM